MTATTSVESVAHPLRTRRFQVLFTSRTLALLGDAVVPVALGLAVLEATGSTSALALLLGCAMVPRLLLLPVGGVAGDRVNVRTVALTTALVRSVTQIFVGLQLLAGAPALWPLAVAEALGGVATAFAQPTFSPLVIGTVPEAQRQQANAAVAAASSAARLAGPPLAGVLLLPGSGWAFISVGVGYAVSAALLMPLRVAHVRPPRRAFLADLREGWTEVRSRDWYWTSLIAHAVWNGAAAVLATLGPAIALRELGGRNVWVTMSTVAGVGLLLGSLVAGRVRLRNPVLTGNLALASYAAPLALLAVPAPAPVIITVYGLAMAGLGFLNPVWETAVQQVVPGTVLARVISYDWLLSLAAMPVGYVLGPLAADAWGPGVPLTVTAVLVGATCLATALVPGVRHFRMPREERVPVDATAAH
ncbi:MFS transporter [Streptomyces sp. RY43-2]|uniref:MFS transporter n=1 Tax=Streptomyces macrolidinus TaxID=2952607 RepID=A0ABT0Z9X2_9ACTN|nr:MFS transporter [Streptomyces macrolidinus]MCN9240565.1 MFS transporter [Streptomyces macrolidinus]